MWYYCLVSTRRDWLWNLEDFIGYNKGATIYVELRGRPLEKWWGAGEVWGIFSLHKFFFSAYWLCRNFFSGETLCTNFLFRQVLLFFGSVKSWFIIYVFVLYKLFYTHNRSKDTGHFLMHNQWERRKPLGVDGFPVHFFSHCTLEFLSHSLS